MKVPDVYELKGIVVSLQEGLQSKGSKRPVDVEVVFEGSTLRLVFTAKKKKDMPNEIIVKSLDGKPLSQKTEKFMISTVCKDHGPYEKGPRTYFYQKMKL